MIERLRARRDRVIPADALREPKSGLDGRALVVAMQASSVAGLDIEPTRSVMPVRDVVLYGVRHVPVLNLWTDPQSSA